MHLENRRKKNSPDREEFLSDSKKGTWHFTELVKDKTTTKWSSKEATPNKAMKSLTKI